MEQYGKYQLLRRIGRGGMAEVFLARSSVAQGLAKTLVIKKIHPAFARSNQFVSMFVDEAKIALGLNHPGIVQVFDFGAAGGTYFLAMEHVEGLDVLRLKNEVKRKGDPFPIGLAAYVVQQVCKALDYAHRKTDEYGEPLSIVHRDISPQNVLVSWDGGVKIVDFGIARARDVHEEEGVIKGKFAYMSPEQARGEPVDRRSDVFSAGVVLFELVTGQPVFPGKGKEVLEKVKQGAIPDPRDHRPDVPQELAQTMLKALAFHRDARFQTARDLQNALGGFLFRFADDARGPIDSSTLAQFLSQVIPREQRAPAAPPPAAPGANGSSRGHVTTVGKGVSAPDTGSQPATPPPNRSEARERKHVFVVEGHMHGTASLERKLGARAAGETVDQFLKVARDIAFKHDAHVHATDRADFTFVIGLPVAGEDDASRTVRMALALIDALDAIGQDVEPELRLSVGVQRGVAILKRGRGRKLDYELSPSTTRLARRLAREAQGAEVLVGGGVYRVAQDDWNFEGLASIELPSDPDTQNGATDPAQRARVYALRGPKERAQRMHERTARSTDLIGRDLELKALRDAFRDVTVSRGKRHAIVLGDQGVGKGSLISSFLAGIGVDDAIVMRAAGRAATSYTPFAIIADLGRDLLGLAEGAEGREVRRRLEMVATSLYPGEEHTREVRGVIHTVGMLLGARFDDTEAPEQVDPEERRQRVKQALLRVEQRLSPDKPLVIVCEDIHWADTESMDLFLEVARFPSTRPMFGIMSGRPEPRVLEAIADSGSDVITLEELSPEATTELIARRFDDGEDVGELARQIIARAGGNPFFINEMLDALTERGIVAGDSGKLRWVERGAPIQVPTRVEALVATRIDQLPPDIKETLTFAAVLGRELSPVQLTAIAGQDLTAELDELCARGLLARSGNGFAFRNDMTMTVAYRLLPDEERVSLHRAAADRLATARSYRPGQDDAVIARHLELAGDASAAAERYRKAAEHAVSVGGSADALRQLSRALKLLPDDDFEARFEARKAREEILRSLARRPEQLREIDRLRRDAGVLGDPARLAWAHCRLAQFYIDVGKADAAERAIEPAIESARRSGDRLAEAESLRLKASVAGRRGHTDQALGLYDRALELCGEQRDGLLQRAAVLNGRGAALWKTGRLHEAIESFAEALVIYRMLKRRRYEARVLNNMGIIFAELQEYEDALAHYKSSLKIDQELGDRAAIPLKLGNIGQTYLDLGDLDRGERYLTKALKLTEQNQDERSSIDILISLGQVYLHRGEVERGRELFERGLHLAQQSNDRYQEIRALIYVALTGLRTGAPDRALEVAERATRLAHDMPMPVGEVFGLALQGTALADLERAPDGAELTARAVMLQERARQPEGAEQILHMHAVVCDRAGMTDEARDAIQRARDEVYAKAQRLHDADLRGCYLSSPIASAISADYDRLTG